MAKNSSKKSSKGKKSGTKNKKSAKRSLSLRLLKWCFVLGLWGLIFLTVILAWFAKDLPDITKAASFDRRPSITVLASDGSVIARYGETKGKSVAVAELPPDLIHAVIATEDRRFYSHPGIDILGITRAMIINIYQGHFVQGGSTISQQLAKNLFLSHERTMKRKIQEALLALWLETQLTKDEILSAYLNRVYLGAGLYGMDAASRVYFNKSVKDVNLREASILAGLLKAPSRYSPSSNPKLALERSDVVLDVMVDAGYINEEQAKNAKKQKLESLSNQPSGAHAEKYFADWVLEGLDDLVGTPDMDLVVKTTLNPSLQHLSEQALTTKLSAEGKDLKISQGAILVMRPDGAVLAMVGGKNYDESQFNRTTQSLRPPGSSFKPVVYLSALEAGWDPEDNILDAPIIEGKYRPENFGKKYYGNVTLSEALAQSMNTATIRLAQNIGISSVISTAKDMGIIAKLEPDLSLALGSSGVSMLEMATAYATLANGGYSVFPYAISSIEETGGRTLYNKKEITAYRNIHNPRAVQNLSKMMRGVIDHGTGTKARLPFPASGKTGTSQNSRDAWFIGFTPEIVTAVWLGNDDNSPMKDVTGGNLPALIWHEIMLASRGKYKQLTFPSASFLDDTLFEQQHPQPIQSENEEKSSFSGMLGKLLSEGNNKTGKKKSGDFSNLND